jgi:hypothetical protein
VPQAQGERIDPDWITDNVQVDVDYPEMEPGEEVTLIWRGTIEATPYEATMIVDDGPLSFFVPKVHLAENDGGIVTVEYQVHFLGGGSARSRVRLLRVGNVLDLLPPSLEEAVGDYIDPARIPNGATARIEAHPDIGAGSRVTLRMRGTTLGGQPVEFTAVRDIGEATPFPLRIVVPVDRIAALERSTATFGYLLETWDAARSRFARGRRAEYGSPSRTYRVANPVSLLPAPSVPDASGDRLHLDAIDEREGARVEVAYPSMTAGDRVTLELRGTQMTEPHSNTLVARDDRLTFFVPKDPFFTGNVHAHVRLGYTVTRDDGVGRSMELVLAIEDARTRRGTRRGVEPGTGIPT